MRCASTCLREIADSDSIVSIPATEAISHYQSTLFFPFFSLIVLAYSHMHTHSHTQRCARISVVHCSTREMEENQKQIIWRFAINFLLHFFLLKFSLVSCDIYLFGWRLIVLLSSYRFILCECVSVTIGFIQLHKHKHIHTYADGREEECITTHRKTIDNEYL